ncbi:BTB/POZ domain-containing protein 17 [Mactra antiquata]
MPGTETPGTSDSCCDEKISNPSLETIENDKLFVNRFACLFNNERLSDIIVNVGDDRFFAHKFILIVCSEVFEVMLNEERWKESSQPEITLTEVEECIPVFFHFLRYMYTGSVGLTTDNVLPILLLADKYCMPALSNTCVEYMTCHIVQSPDTNRTLSWYQYAKMTGNSILVDKCRKFILSNFDIILKTSDWTELLRTEVVEFLMSSDLVVSNEYDLWLQVKKWLLHDKNVGELEENIEEVIPLLRFKMIPPKQLLEIEKSELHSTDEYGGIFKQKLNEAYRHHSLLMNQVNVERDGNKYRNYTSPIYGLCIDMSLLHYHYVEKFESKICKQVSIPIEYVASSDDSREVKFEVIFWPKGPFKTFNWYGHTSENATMSVRMLSREYTSVEVTLALILYGIKNGIKYVAFTYNNKHTFNSQTTMFTEENVVSLKKLTAKNSPCLVNGNIEAKLFIKIENIEGESRNDQ